VLGVECRELRVEKPADDERRDEEQDGKAGIA
jgi:hypothetical protein